jgi:hypothetical protein
MLSTMRLTRTAQRCEAMDAFLDQVIHEIGQDLLLEATLFVQRCNQVREDAMELAIAHPFLLPLIHNDLSQSLLIKAKALSYMLLKICNSALQG